jgi:hypothetical protein
MMTIHYWELQFVLNCGIEGMVLDTVCFIRAIEVLLSNSAGNTRKTCGGVICGSWRIFFLSCRVLYFFIFSRDPFKDALNM